MTPTVSRLVHYVLPTGEHRNATVISAEPRLVLKVDLDPFQDFSGRGIVLPEKYLCEFSSLYIPDPREDQEEKTPDSWHWPERT